MKNIILIGLIFIYIPAFAAESFRKERIVYLFEAKAMSSEFKQVGDSFIPEQCPECFTWDGKRFFKILSDLKYFLEKNCYQSRDELNSVDGEICDVLLPVTGDDFDGSVISEKLADNLSRFFLYREDITFEYFEDLCYARNVIMREVLSMLRIQSSSVFIKADRSNDLVAQTRFGVSVTWRWHVAPTVSVRMSDGSIQRQIIDPSLLTYSVSIEEWGKVMQQNDCPRTQDENNFLSLFNHCHYYIDLIDDIFEIDLGRTGYRRAFRRLSRDQRIHESFDLMNDVEVRDLAYSRRDSSPRVDFISGKLIEFN